MSDKQLSIDFDPDITKAFESCVDYVQCLMHRQGVPQKAIAADMDLSPSHLSRKLSQNPNDSMRFTVDDLERFIQVTGDVEPIRYLVAKYMVKQEVSEKEAMQARIDELESKLSLRGGL